jgi:PII-like signaling protein
MNTAVQVTIYLNESDKWNQILQMLRRENVAGASAFHAVAGFNGRNQVHTAGLVEAGGNLPGSSFAGVDNFGHKRFHCEVEDGVW